jgi:hypothetical protein
MFMALWLAAFAAGACGRKWPKFCRCWSGRACLLCPGISDINLVRYRESIIYLDAEVSDGAFDLGVAEQELHGP